MKNYIITIINDKNLIKNVQHVVEYLGINNCNSTCYNYLEEYASQSTDTSFNDYCDRAINTKINNTYDNTLTKKLAENIIKDSFTEIESTLTEEQIHYISSLDYITDLIESPLDEPDTLSTHISENTRESFVNNNPNTNNSLQAQNTDFENFKLGNINIFNYLESPENTTFKYNSDDTDIECDIIVIDNGVHGGHENFIINSKNICQIDEQRNLPWQLAKLYRLIGRRFISGNTPEGVSIEDPNFHSYFTPPAVPPNPRRPGYNHGTHVAGTICGINSSWIRSNRVKLYSIPYLLFQTSLIRRVMELSILDFHLNKIRHNDKIPTFVNRSYGSNITNNNLLNFSNFGRTYRPHWFYTRLINNHLQFQIIQSRHIQPFLDEIQKKFGIVNVTSGGNSTELQLKWSDNSDNYFNYYIKDNDRNIYPYLPRSICLKEEFWTIGGLTLSELNYDSTLNINIVINFSLINKTLDENPINIHRILSKTHATIIVGSLGTMNLAGFNYLQNQNVGFLSNYTLSGFSAFGDALIYASGAPIRSCVAYNDRSERANNFYNSIQGTSMSCPNATGILAKYLTRQYSRFTIDVEKIFMNTSKYIQYYIDDNLRNVYKNLDSNQFPNRNSFFYIGLARNNLNNINQIYPLHRDSNAEIYVPVLYYNKDYEITRNIPKQLATFTYESIKYDGNEWTFGTMRTDIFSKENNYYRVGNYRLHNQ